MRLNVVELRQSLADILNRAEYQGERIVIHRRGKDAAAIISIEDLKLLERLIEDAEDRLDVNAARDALAESNERIPTRRCARNWDSTMSKKRNGRVPRPEPRRFEIRVHRAAERGLAGLDTAMLHRIDAAICGLAVAPHPPGSKKLRGTDDFFRIRVGDYRVIYQVEDEQLVVLVLNVGHRSDIYRDR